VQYLIQHGYTHLTSYEPASWFWPFQWIEGSWLLALSLVLIGNALLSEVDLEDPSPRAGVRSPGREPAHASGRCSRSGFAIQRWKEQRRADG
jgi:hypothetical protein